MITKRDSISRGSCFCEKYNCNIVPAQVDKMRAELAGPNHCAVPFFKPHCRQLVLVLLYSHTLVTSANSLTITGVCISLLILSPNFCKMLEHCILIILWQNKPLFILWQNKPLFILWQNKPIKSC